MKTQAEKQEPEDNQVTALPIKKGAGSRRTPCGLHQKISSFDDQEKSIPAFDRLLHAKMGKVFGLSPASLGMAWTDWMTQLMQAPGKQAELAKSALEKAASLGTFIQNQAMHCVEPLPQDRRFEDEEWKEWPYNFYQQAFLLTEQWWQEATNVRGVTQHHETILPFMARQMLDMVSPLNFPLTNPHIVKATVEQGGLNFYKGMKNLFDDSSRRLSHKEAAGMEKFKVGENIAVTKGSVVYQNRLIELIQYAPATAEVYAEPILIVPAWIMKYYILDLSPENSLVKYLVDQGHTVFMISWKNPDSGDRDLGFEDYLNLGIMDALNAINGIMPGQNVHAAGYCLGGTLLSIAAAAMARDGDDRLKSVTLFAAQTDFEEAGELMMFIDESQLSWLEDGMWEKGYLDSQDMAGTFQMLHSRDLVWSPMIEEYMVGERRPPNDLMAWNADATRMPYKMHSEYLRSLFLNNDLSEGHFTVDGRPIALSDIRTPVFAVSTQRDHVAPWHSVYKITLFADTDVTFVLTSGGHNAGIVSEPGHPHRTFQTATLKNAEKYISPDEWCAHTPMQEGSWWPVWHEWLAQKSTKEKIPAPAPAKGLRAAPGDYILQK